jgi:hypothetical protein
VSESLKSWAVESSDDGASWTKIDRREKNSNFNGGCHMKTFAVAQSGSFRRIHLRQIGPNHFGNNHLVLSAFELFGAVAGLQETISVQRFLSLLRFSWANCALKFAIFFSQLEYAAANCMNCRLKSQGSRACLSCCSEVQRLLPQAAASRPRAPFPAPRVFPLTSPAFREHCPIPPASPAATALPAKLCRRFAFLPLRCAFTSAFPEYLCNHLEIQHLLVIDICPTDMFEPPNDILGGERALDPGLSQNPQMK